jgi:hypothetical protein
MPIISFKAKVETIYNADETPAWRWIKVPAIERRHCDMAAFRSHAKYGSYANSDMFGAIVKRAFKEAGVKEYIKLHEIPANVTIDESGFLAKVTINI